MKGREDEEKKAKRRRMFFTGLPYGIVVCVFIVFYLILHFGFHDEEANSTGLYQAVILLFSMFGFCLSLFAVYYGRQAYLVAQDIFKKGIDIDKDKVLEKAGMEFALDFFVPLGKLNKQIKDYRNPDISEAPVSGLYDAFKKNKLPESFRYFDTHKSEIFDALGRYGDQEQDFGTVNLFVGDAVRFQQTVDGVIRVLEKNKDGGLKLKDLFTPAESSGTAHAACRFGSKMKTDKAEGAVTDHGRPREAGISRESIQLVMDDMKNLEEYKKTLSDGFGVCNKISLIYRDNS